MPAPGSIDLQKTCLFVGLIDFAVIFVGCLFVDVTSSESLMCLFACQPNKAGPADIAHTASGEVFARRGFTSLGRCD